MPTGMSMSTSLVDRHSIVSETSATVRLGSFASSAATTPVTSGVEYDVPLTSPTAESSSASATLTKYPVDNVPQQSIDRW